MFSSALKKLAIGIALAGMVGLASATTYNLEVLDSTKTVSDIYIDGNFDDTFHFTIGTLPKVTGSIVGMDMSGDLMAQYRFGIGDDESSAQWSLWSSLAAVPSDSIGMFDFSLTDDDLLLGKTYWFNVKGSGSNAFYSVMLEPSAVPEPGTLALLLISGLGFVGVATRRRQANAQMSGG